VNNQEKIAELKLQKEAIDKQITELEKEPIRWKPKNGERYYVPINPCLDYCFDCIWYNDGYDNNCYDLGNCYQTREEAIEKGNVEYYTKKFKEMSDVTDEMWNDYNCMKCFACYDYPLKKIMFSDSYGVKDANSYFTSKAKLLEAIAEIGEDNFTKYVLGVK